MILFSTNILYYFQDNKNIDDNNNNNLSPSKFDLEMVKSVDSTDLPSGKGDKSAAKKIKQIRLPYGSIKINAYKAEPFWSGNKSVKRDNAGGRKRKHSEEMSETFGHTDIAKTPTSINSINTPKSGVQTPKSSPVLDGLRRKIRVEMARLSVQVH